MKIRFSVINNLNEWDITLFNNRGAKCNGSEELQGAEVSLNIREHRVHSMYPWHSESYGFGWGRYGYPFRDYQYFPLRTKRGEEVQGEIAVTSYGFEYRVNGQRVHGIRFHYPNLLTDCVAFETNVTMTSYWIEGNDDCEFRSNDKPDERIYPRKTSTIPPRSSTQRIKPPVQFSTAQSVRPIATKSHSSNKRPSTVTTIPVIIGKRAARSRKTYPCPSGIKMIEGRRLPRNSMQFTMLFLLLLFAKCNADNWYMPVCDRLQPGMEVHFMVHPVGNEFILQFQTDSVQMCNASLDTSVGYRSFHVNHYQIHPVYPFYNHMYALAAAKPGQWWDFINWIPMALQKGQPFHAQINVKPGGYDYLVDRQYVGSVLTPYAAMKVDCVLATGEGSIPNMWIQGQPDCQYRNNDSPDPIYYSTTTPSTTPSSTASTTSGSTYPTWPTFSTSTPSTWPTSSTTTPYPFSYPPYYPPGYPYPYFPPPGWPECIPPYCYPNATFPCHWACYTGGPYYCPVQCYVVPNYGYQPPPQNPPCGVVGLPECQPYYGPYPYLPPPANYTPPTVPPNPYIWPWIPQYGWPPTSYTLPPGWPYNPYWPPYYSYPYTTIMPPSTTASWAPPPTWPTASTLSTSPTTTPAWPPTTPDSLSTSLTPPTSSVPAGGPVIVQCEFNPAIKITEGQPYPGCPDQNGVTRALACIGPNKGTIQPGQIVPTGCLA
ncbi:unnamed protein product [Bursaphelenchus xylophilus]|uniref:(pine wood nematode) hypothetical protein n=1 Tax=Bursaphelenchus xylophilus TaxID=6326 RepID=A0A1I7RMM1_BURXY|nr:unnamed protein product [Bursaphelenchus xylophilus]CAG9125680.1 unnamed protein product [Bursaphelenchus xylophilus]